MHSVQFANPSTLRGHRSTVHGHRPKLKTKATLQKAQVTPEQKYMRLKDRIL